MKTVLLKNVKPVMVEYNMNNRYIYILSVCLPILANTLYRLSDYYFSRANLPLVDFLVIVGVIMTLIIQFYGTYLILMKHIKTDTQNRGV